MIIIQENGETELVIQQWLDEHSYQYEIKGGE